jgi:mannosyltransferase
MKIYYDNIIYSLQKAGGISVVWANLIQEILRREASLRFLEYEGALGNISRKELIIPSAMIEDRKSRLLAMERFINPTIKEEEHFIFHSSYYRTCNNPNAINVTTVHDFIYNFYCQNYLSKYIHCKQMYSAIRKSDAVVCISNNTKKDLVRLLPDIDPNKVYTIYNGVGNSFYFAKDHTVRDYAMFVGNRKGYKNFLKIIEAVAISKLELMVIGSPLTEKEERLLKNAGCRFKQRSFVSDEELNELYNHAFCLIYPSEYEGFGLPIIEAQKAGCPVIACNRSSVPEVIGDKRLLMENVNTSEILRLIKPLKDAEFRDSVVKTGMANTERFSWERMADQYWQLYNQLWQNKRK